MSFVAFCRQHGVLIDALPPIGRWRRYKTEDKPKHRNGAVKYMGDVGFVQNHATMIEVAVWHPDKAADPAELERNARRLEEARRHEAAVRGRAIHAMRAHFASLPALRFGHPYLDRKGLSMQGCTGLRVDGDRLVIPAYRDDSLVSIQTISPDGEKLYRKDCPMQGATFVLTRRGAVLTCIAEGLATGLAVFQSLPIANVIVCFDLGNMVRVAKYLKVRGMVVVCGDNDWETANRKLALTGVATNPGVEQGRQAAELIGCGLAYPQGIAGSDWADALIEWGDRGPARLKVEIMRHARPVFPREAAMR